MDKIKLMKYGHKEKYPLCISLVIDKSRILKYFQNENSVTAKAHNTPWLIKFDWLG